MKLIRREPESDALADWLDARATTTDKRLLGAAEALGLPVASPGAVTL